MKNNKLSLIIAIVLALIAGLMVFAYTVGADRRALEGATVKQAYVAQSNLAAGTSLQGALDSQQIALENFPASAVPADAITNITQTNSSDILLSPVSKGQLLLSSLTGDEGTVLSGLRIPDGKVAIAIQLADPEHVATFVVPGSQVALYATLERVTTNRSELVSRVLLPRILVLAVGSSTGAVEEKSKGGAIITVAATPQEATRIVQATRNGQIYMALLGDTTDASESSEISTDDLLGE